ncbi:MAG: permease prefix domain 2-containing transporter [Bryobacteraceae bacterium]
MISQGDFAQPSRIAVWLLDLFAPAEEAESIVGDLHEEFSLVVSKSGVAFARRWYWRETVTTIASLFGTAFRTAPWTMLATVVGGFWLIGFATRSSLHAMQTILDAHRFYEFHPDAYLFWLKFPLEIGRIILCAAVGACVALMAKKREMAAAMGLALVQIALFLVGAGTLIATGRDWVEWFVVMLPWNCASAIATMIGGVIVRTRRSAPTTRPSAT